jgi:pimeloyl-ACP methyl ester carboxylesterase
MEKITIQNRKKQNIVVLLEKAENQKGLAFVMHGLGGFKEQPHIETFAKAFSDAGYTVVRFDTTNTYGESDGNYSDATTTNYYEDLEDVIDWASSQNWYQEPFVLVGHSLGGISTALYAQKHPEKVSGLAPISTVASGELSLKSFSNEELEKWKKTGWKEQKSESIPGLIKRLKWSHIEDRLKYDLLPDAGKLTMPVLLIVGDKDEHLLESQTLFNAIPTDKKELHIIKGAPHTFKDPEHLVEIKEIFDKWVSKL